jgi:hypothetical protein
MADLKMMQRALNVTEVINEPTLKDKTINVYESCEHSIADTRLLNQDVIRLAALREKYEAVTDKERAL